MVDQVRQGLCFALRHQQTAMGPVHMQLQGVQARSRPQAQQQQQLAQP